MFNNKVIGDLQLKHIDFNKKTVHYSIHLINDTVKNKGYEIQAEILAVEYTFTNQELETIFADVLVKNKRSRRVMEKAGFVIMNRDDTFINYRCDRRTWSCPETI